jgi:Fe-coproporphyrin III synthase
VSTLYARREHFGVLLYSKELGTYVRISEPHARALQQFVESGQRLELKGVSYETFTWIDNPLAFPTALSAPLKLFFNLTKRCSLFCHHCYNDSGHDASPEMPAHRVLSLLKELQQLGVFRITLAGGEPTYHRSFREILSAIELSSLTVSMVTNGMSLGGRLVKQLAEAERLRSIAISIDGANSSANDQVRGSGSFELVVAGARRLRAGYKHAVHLRMTLTRPAIATLMDVPSLLAATGINSLKVNRCNPYGRAADRLDLVPTVNEYEAAWETLRTLAEQYGFDIEIPSRKYIVEPSGVLGLCRAGEETAEIDADGNLYPCSFSWGRFSAGNLHETPTRDAFLTLQRHSINNEFCMQCRGRGGTAPKPPGHTPRMPIVPVTPERFEFDRPTSH